MDKMLDTGQVAGLLAALVIMLLLGNGNYAQTDGELFLLGLPRLDNGITVELIIVNQRALPVNVTLKCPGAGGRLFFEIATVLKVPLPHNWLASNTGRDNKGITIATTYDVTIYCVYKNNSKVTTMFSVLSVDDIKQSEYYVISPISPASEEDRLTLTASEVSTRVRLTAKSGTSVSFVSGGIQYFTSNRSFVLDAHESITLVGNLSFDGVRIHSTKPVAALLQINMENNTVSLEQLHPTVLWGTTFHAPNLDLDDSLYESIYTITAIYNNTTVLMWDSRKSSHVMNEGRTEEFSILWNVTLLINATQPIMVKHYIRGTSSNISKQLWAVPPDDRQFYAFDFPSIPYVFDQNVTEIVKIATTKSNKFGLSLDSDVMHCSWMDFNGAGASLCTQDVTSHSNVHTTLHRWKNVTSPQLTYTYAICDEWEVCTLPMQWGRDLKPCVPTTVLPKDEKDNDCDGFVDEEVMDGLDNDGDGLIDEDFGPVNITTTALPTTTTTKPKREVRYETDDDDEMVMRNFPALFTAIIASLSAAVLLVIVCILGFVIAECRCNPSNLRNSKILPFVG